MGKIDNTQSPLTECELEILKFICKGRSNEQIADIISLHISTKHILFLV